MFWCRAAGAGTGAAETGAGGVGTGAGGAWWLGVGFWGRGNTAVPYEKPTEDLGTTDWKSDGDYPEGEVAMLLAKGIVLGDGNSDDEGDDDEDDLRA